MHVGAIHRCHPAAAELVGLQACMLALENTELSRLRAESDPQVDIPAQVESTNGVERPEQQFRVSS